MSKGGGGSTQTIQKSDPWAGVQPNLVEEYGRATAASHNPPAYYPNNTVAGRDWSTQRAEQETLNRAFAGSPVNDTAQNQAVETMRGDYMNNPAMRQLAQIGSGSMLNANPYISQMFNQQAQGVGQQFRNNVMPGVASMYSGAGRYGSNSMDTGMQQAEKQYGDTLNNLATSTYGNNYAMERGLQNQALGEYGTQFGRERAMQANAMQAAPGLAATDYTDLGQAMGIGQNRDAYAQTQLNSDIGRWDFNQNRENTALQQLNSVLNGSSAYAGGSSQSTSNAAPGNPIMGALGGGLGGYALGSSLAGTAMGGSLASTLGMGLGPLGGIMGALMGGLFR